MEDVFEIEKTLTDEQLDAVMIESIVPKSFITDSDFTKLAKIDLRKYASILKKTYKDKKTQQDKSMSFSYLSWAVAFQILFSVKPNSSYGTREWKDPVLQMEVPYLKTPLGFLVETYVTVDGVTRVMSLPVMDQKNNVIMNPDMFDINKSIMRCYVKNLAMFGIGIQFFNKETELDLNKLDAELNKVLPPTTPPPTLTVVESTLLAKLKKHSLDLVTVAPALKKWYPDTNGNVNNMKTEEIEHFSNWIDTTSTSQIKEKLGVKDGK